jgi:hypothetical protein
VTFIARLRSPDISIDRVVEIKDGTRPTGREFGVQVKGTDDEYKDKKFHSFSVETDTVKYWVSDYRHPVFVVRAFVGEQNTEKKIFWCCVDTFIEELDKTKPEWSKQETISFHFLKENDFNNLNGFLSELEKAERIKRDKFPSSPLAAIKARRKQLEKEHPGLIVQDYEVKGESEHVSFVAAKPFSMSFGFTNKESSDQFFGSIDRPRSLSIPLEHIEFDEAGPMKTLFDRAKHGTLEFRPPVSDEGSIIFSCEGEGPRNLVISTLIEGGNGKLLITTKNNSTPFYLSLLVAYNFDTKTIEITEHEVRHDFSCWRNTNLEDLHEFERVAGVFLAIFKKKKIEAEVYVKQGHVFSFSMIPNDEEYMQGVLYLDLIARMRFLQPLFEEKLRFGKKAFTIDETSLYHIEELISLSKEGVMWYNFKRAKGSNANGAKISGFVVVFSGKKTRPHDAR